MPIITNTMEERTKWKIIPAYFKKDPKKGLNWFRNVPWSSSPRHPAITVSRTLLLQSTADQLVMCENSVACVNVDTDDGDICMSVYTSLCICMNIYTRSQATYI